MSEKLTITWIGHSCFLLERGDYRIVFDPYEDGYVPGCPLVRTSADLVLTSHDHKDHGASHLVKRITGRENPFQIQVMDTWHDDQKGALRGANKIHILDDGVFRIAHLGDLGCELEEADLEQLKNLDVLMIPVGGYYTIDAGQAKALADQLHPKIVIPMHYRGDGFGYDVLGTVDLYTKLCKTVFFADSPVLELEKSVGAVNQASGFGAALQWRTGNDSGILESGQEETVVLRMARA